MRLRLLGPLELHGDRGPLRLGGRKDRLLLVRLALAPGRVVPRDALIESLWGRGERPEDPANALQVKISRLRKLIGRDRVLTRAPGYVLDIDESDIDVLMFRQLVDTGRRASRQGAHDDALAAFTRALALWRGPALLDVAEDEAVDIERMRLEDERVDAIEERVETELALGRHGAVLGELQALVREHPLRERLRAQLMIALYREGRQAEALGVFADARRVLVEEVGLEPGPELASLQRQILAHDPALHVADGPAEHPPAAVPQPTPGNVREPRTSFVGRVKELERITAELERTRILTLTGPGGVGKTRLALEAARRLTGRSVRAAWVADVSHAEDLGGVIEAVSAAVGLRHVGHPLTATLPGIAQVDRIVASFVEGDVLLVLDNCEHVLPAVAEVVEILLARCPPSTHVLVTSRAPLGVEGEREIRVPPLARSDAKALFVDRARAARAAFAPTEDESAAVDDICRQLDCMPLALELAAARVKVLPLDQIAARLVDRLDLLVARSTRPRRHQTLRATVDWSYELLSEDERIVFELLSIFKGGASYEAIEALCGEAGIEPAAVLDLVSRLVDKSILQADLDAGSWRYSMLTMLRSYGAEKLDESGRGPAARRAHAALFARLAESAEPLLKGPEQAAALERLQRDEDNHLAALDWAIANGESELGLRHGISLWWYWYLAGKPHEGRRRLVALARDSDAPAALRARALGTAGHLAERLHQLDEALALTEEAVALAELTDDAYVRASAVGHRGQVLGRLGRARAACEGLRESIAGFTELGATWEAALVQLTLGYNHLRNEELDAARNAFHAALDQFDAAGDRWCSIRLLTALAAVAEVSRDREAAGRYVRRAVAIARGAGLEGVARRLDAIAADRGSADAEAGPGVVTPDAQPLACNRLGQQARRRGDLALARALHSEALAWYRAMEWPGGTAVARAGLAAVAHAEHDLRQSAFLYGQALDDAFASGDAQALAVVLESLAAAAVASDAPERAGLLVGAANAIRAGGALPRTAAQRREADRVAEAAAAAVGRARFQEDVARGERAYREIVLDAAGAAIEALLPPLAVAVGS